MNHMSTTYHELRAHHFSKKFAGSSFQLKQTISDRVALSVISERSPTERQVLNIIQFYHRKIKVHVCIIRPWLKYFQLNLILTLHKFPPALFLAWIFLSRFQEHSTPSPAYPESGHIGEPKVLHVHVWTFGLPGRVGIFLWIDFLK